MENKTADADGLLPHTPYIRFLSGSGEWIRTTGHKVRSLNPETEATSEYI